MPEVATELKTYRFDQMAVQVKDKVHPDDADVDRYVGLEHIDPESLKIRRWGEPSDVESTKILFRAGDIIFGKRRAYQRKLAVADFDGICSAHAMVLRPKTDVVLKEFLPFFMQTDAFMERAVKISVGGLSPTINWSDLAKEEFNLPSVEDQRHACKALSAARDVIERTENLIDASRIAQSAAFESMTTPPNCRVVELGSLLVESPRNGCSAPPSSQETGHWVLALSAISRWGYRCGELKPVEPTDAMIQARIAAGDLVVSRSNTRELVGLPAVFDEERADVSYPDTMMRLRFDPDETDSRFVELALRSRKTRRQVQSFAAGTSSSMKKINGTNLRKVEVPHPPLDLQQRIVQELSTFRQQIELAAARRTRAQRVMAELLKSAIGDGGDTR